MMQKRNESGFEGRFKREQAKNERLNQRISRLKAANKSVNKKLGSATDKAKRLASRLELAEEELKKNDERLMKATVRSKDINIRKDWLISVLRFMERGDVLARQ